MLKNRFSLLPERCPLCKEYNIHEVIIQSYDFKGFLTEQKKMCRSCNATFDKDCNIETIAYNQGIVDA